MTISLSLTNTYDISVDLLSLSYLDVSVHLVYLLKGLP